MKKKKPVAMIAATLVLLLVAGALFVACNKDVGVGSMGVEPYPDKFTNDLDTVDAEDLTAGAQITASSAAETAANVLDGSTETAWTAENTSGQFLEITFSEPVSFNTVVLRENGNYISGFSFVTPDENGEYPTDGYGYFENFFYRQQDRIERYRYCTFDAVEVTTFRIYFERCDEGKDISIAEVEIYNIAPKEYENDFRVFNYYRVDDFYNMTDEEAAALADELDRGVITDMILISFVFWEEDGSLVYASENGFAPEDRTSDPTFYNQLLDRIVSIVGDRNVNICMDLFPSDLSAHGLPGNMDTLMENITSLIADDDRVDGIDFDWEYPNGVTEWKYYGDLIMRVSEAIDSSGEDKYISLALSADNVRLTQEQIDAVDFVQMMAYDRFDIMDGNHSSFRSGAYSSMRYFVNIGFKPSQLVLGIPLYGRPTSWDTVWTNYGYGETVYSTQSKDPYTYWDNTQWLYYTGTNLDGSIKYDNEFMQVWVNGAALIADKTAYVIEQGFAGVMLWRESTDYAWDAVDGNGMPRSALRSIYDTACDRIVGYGENA